MFSQYFVNPLYIHVFTVSISYKKVHFVSSFIFKQNNLNISHTNTNIHFHKVKKKIQIDHQKDCKTCKLMT